MKSIILAVMSFMIVSCGTDNKGSATQTSVSLPYVATYSSQFDQNVSDKDLLTVLSNYKAWENGDMEALRATMGDSIIFHAANGNIYTGPTSGLMDEWRITRLDCLSTVAISMNAWVKTHSIDKNQDFINVWYTIRTEAKSGRMDSAHYQDFNMVQDGKIAFISRHRQVIK